MDGCSPLWHRRPESWRHSSPNPSGRSKKNELIEELLKIIFGMDQQIRHTPESRTLLAQMNALQELVVKQNSEIDELKGRVDALSAQFAAANESIQRLTVREICRSIERHIVLKVVGSKTKARYSLFNFAKVKNDPAYQHILDTYLAELGLGTTDLIDALKDDGDRVGRAGKLCDVVSVDDFRSLIEREDDDDEIRSKKAALVRALGTFKLVDAQNNIVLTDPF